MTSTNPVGHSDHSAFIRYLKKEPFLYSFQKSENLSLVKFWKLHISFKTLRHLKYLQRASWVSFGYKIKKYICTLIKRSGSLRISWVRCGKELFGNTHPRLHHTWDGCSSHLAAHAPRAELSRTPGRKTGLRDWNLNKRHKKSRVYWAVYVKCMTVEKSQRK